jgi:hypothetical protein
VSAHTPGPWKSSGQTGTGNFDSRNQGALAIGVHSEEWIVADVWDEFGEGEGHANARLIAAAPDLLEALIDAREQLRAYEQAISGEDYNSPAINAAIAKATGSV